MVFLSQLENEIFKMPFENRRHSSTSQEELVVVVVVVIVVIVAVVVFIVGKDMHSIIRKIRTN